METWAHFVANELIHPQKLTTNIIQTISLSPRYNPPLLPYTHTHRKAQSLNERCPRPTTQEPEATHRTTNVMCHCLACTRIRVQSSRRDRKKTAKTVKHQLMTPKHDRRENPRTRLHMHTCPTKRPKQVLAHADPPYRCRSRSRSRPGPKSGSTIARFSLRLLTMYRANKATWSEGKW